MLIYEKVDRFVTIRDVPQNDRRERIELIKKLKFDEMMFRILL